MVDLKKPLPDSIFVSGSFYDIQTDFRFWLMFQERLRNKEIKTSEDLKFLFIDSGNIPEDTTEMFSQILAFYQPPRKLPRDTGKRGNGKRVIDFKEDEDLIFSAFFEVYGIDLTEARLHWFKFLALLNGLHNTKLNEVMGYRGYDENDKSEYKDSMIDLRNAWELEEEQFTEKDKKDLERFNEIFK